MARRPVIIVVPPQGTRIRALRIRVSFLVLMLLFAVAGITGLFVPYEKLGLDATEKIQQRNLLEQNSKLMTRIRAIRQSLTLLKGHISRLGERREELAQPLRQTKASLQFSLPWKSRQSISEIVADVSREESLLVDFVNRFGRDSTFFRSIPVLRPLAKSHIITNRFGKQRDIFTGKIKMHNGVDLVAEIGTPVIATADGTVEKCENHPLWGLRIRIKHESGFSTVYAHLGTIRVTAGRRVRRGEIIGTSGGSGVASGPHVHYEVHKRGKPLDPEGLFYPESILLADVVSR